MSHIRKKKQNLIFFIFARVMEMGFTLRGTPCTHNIIITYLHIIYLILRHGHALQSDCVYSIIIIVDFCRILMENIFQAGLIDLLILSTVHYFEQIIASEYVTRSTE